MAKEELGKQLSDFIAQFGAGGGVDLPDCAVGAMCSQIDVEAADFITKVKSNYPEKLKPMNASLKIVFKKTNKNYSYYIGVDADGVVHNYHNIPIQKIMNIWNFGTADGKTPRTMFWGKAVRGLKRKYERATDRFFDILDGRYEGRLSHVPNSGNSVDSKILNYQAHKSEYLSADELAKVTILDNTDVPLQ